MKPVASIIIPTYQHAAYLPDAIESALAQTVPVEVIVIDDGSTDATFDILRTYVTRAVRGACQKHAGVAAARNAGIEKARGEFIQFLDADDVIAPNKIDRQLEWFPDDVGWALCDVRIEYEDGRSATASENYGYADMELDGWIGPLLDPRNFIPNMSPLYRADVLREIRFPEGKLEDWAFLRMVAAVARVAYVPEVLATYRRRRGGRHNAK